MWRVDWRDLCRDLVVYFFLCEDTGVTSRLGRRWLSSIPIMGMTFEKQKSWMLSSRSHFASHIQCTRVQQSFVPVLRFYRMLFSMGVRCSKGKDLLRSKLECTSSS